MYPFIAVIICWFCILNNLDLWLICTGIIKHFVLLSQSFKVFSFSETYTLIFFSVETEKTITVYKKIMIVFKVWCKSHLKSFYSYGDVTFNDEGLQNLGFCIALIAFWREGSLSYLPCCDTWPCFCCRIRRAKFSHPVRQAMLVEDLFLPNSRGVTNFMKGFSGK